LGSGYAEALFVATFPDLLFCDALLALRSRFIPKMFRFVGELMGSSLILMLAMPAA